MKLNSVSGLEPSAKVASFASSGLASLFIASSPSGLVSQPYGTTPRKSSAPGPPYFSASA
jgi:hypothetical protein